MSTKGIPGRHEDERVQRAVHFMLKYKTRARADPAPATDVDIPGAWRPSWARRRLPSTDTTINSTSGARRAIGLTTSTGFGPWKATTRACRHNGRAVETTTDTSHFRPPPLPRGDAICLPTARDGGGRLHRSKASGPSRRLPDHAGLIAIL
ncbi:hypothetical protein THAOC_12220 [Thalassiosira oceanica]|uniref:Uncharacterized protein n=1 Tax=Thalassiosira oceanica TaxID=159749 RepID=K0SPA3_THAOC|nr:hypothetical protein THAOC_12220 [Thalassiosira oceanica]|eukprot:EJK66819.1 hypothetical protein THAOC_12220 [Thalassiosira oceanica]